ncbi:protein-glutamate methylesterase/protein-glutamine glutaminase [Bacillus sp. PS06]|uniref:protein-glutamate methylesterase/protein-glutamine glutaminase n=1 Tax=Bacillus sp. PS06 TaxID=2764176 RepID=UPI00177B1679|nr:chemotaxis response regulator protein-glutamate methylesterase [Bacillus sp. PS06]MBD8068280.1 chemotaxis response regulator protein-glutamate methylesterase [Bacillus sp. PS06]
MNQRIKVFVVDDSAFMRKLITDILTSEPLIEVIGTARNGEDCLMKLQTLKPDVITMDVEMPVMNGLEALKVIMERYQLPVIMLSSTTNEGAANSITAMQYGAIDFITKPSGAISLDLHKVKDEIISKVLHAKKANISTLIKPLQPEKLSYNNKDDSEKELVSMKKGIERKLVVIGTSTGGPRALQQVLTKLPSNFPAPILIVQHMPAGFTNSLAKRLNSISDIGVKEAENGELLKNGVAYIAPGGHHLKIKEVGTVTAIHLDDSDLRNGHRPAVDVLFESVSQLANYRKIAVIMTGMGSDGAKGLISLKQSGSTTAIAESEQTSVVFGMPKMAIETNLVDEVANVDNIADVILKYIGK